MKQHSTIIFCLGLILAPLSASAQDKTPKEKLDLTLQLAHCLAYYRVAEKSPDVDAIDKDLAAMGKDILDLTVVIEEVDEKLLGDMADILAPHVAAMPGGELFDLYDDACDKVME